MPKKKKKGEIVWVIQVPLEFKNHCEVVKFMRTQRKLTQGQLAKKIGTKQSAIARLETSKRLPSLRTLLKISVACGFHMEAPKFANVEEANRKFNQKKK